MPTYQVTLKTPEGDHTIAVADDQYIFDAAEENDIDLPIFSRSWWSKDLLPKSEKLSISNFEF
jgi:hypothetical protein